VDTGALDFKLVIINDQVLTGTATSIKIQMKNGQPLDKNLVLTYSLTPLLDEDKSKVQLVHSESKIVIERTVLRPDWQYNLLVTITDEYAQIKDPDCKGCRVEHNLKIKAKSDAPSAGLVKITPDEGIANETQFTVELSEWQSTNYPLRAFISCFARASKITVLASLKLLSPFEPV